MTRHPFLFLSVCIAGSALAQAPVIQWQNTPGGSNTEQAYGGQQTADGGYIIAGETSSSDGDVVGNHGGPDGWLVKLDAAGAISWQYAAGGTSSDGFYAVQQTPDNGYIAAGYSASSSGDVSNNHGDLDAWVVKFDDMGSIAWEHSFGGVATDVANAIAATADGGYIMAGTSTTDQGASMNHGLSDCWVVKLDAGGGITWQVLLGGSSYDNANSVVQLADGNFLISGFTESSNGDVSGQHGQQDVWVMKVGSTGALLWSTCLGGSGFDYAYHTRETSDGGSIVAASSTSTDGDVTGNHGFNDAWIVKLDASGSIEWEKSLGGTSSDRAKDIQETADGGYILVGDADSQDGDLSGDTGIADIWLVKVDVWGAIEWQRTLGGSSTETSYALDRTADGGYFIAGVASSNDGDVSGVTGDGDMWAVKLSAAGVGIAEQSSTELYIGPNPCANALTISTSQADADMRLTLSDALGREVKQQRMTGLALTMDLGDQPRGAYMLTVRSAEGIRTARIVLQ